MKKNHSGKRGPPDSAPQLSQPDKVGWIRKFCGKGIFREIWKNRFVVLRGDQLFVCEKEVKEPGRADQVLDLSDYERCEDVRKNKSRSKKNHSKFRLQRCSSPGNMVPNLVFLAVSPEEKESWINVLNAAITRAKNRILDEVMVEDSQLCHLTRDRVKIPHNRRLPTRGHLLAVASSSDGALTLDLIQEEEVLSPLEAAVGSDNPRTNLDKSLSHLSPDCPQSKTDGALSSRSSEALGKSRSLPREAVVVWETPQSGEGLSVAEKNRCASMDHIATHTETDAPKNKAASSPTSCSVPAAGAVSRLQQLIDKKLEETEQLLAGVQGGTEGRGRGEESSKGARAEAEKLLQQALLAWSQAQEILEEVKELRVLCQQLDPPLILQNCTKGDPDPRSPK